MSFDRTYKQNKQTNRDYNFIYIDDFKDSRIKGVQCSIWIIGHSFVGWPIYSLHNIFLSANFINLFLGDIHRD